MIGIIEADRQKIAELCRRHHVARLEVFGSAAGPGPAEARSDVDFLVEFERGADLGPWLSRYFQLQRELEALLGRAVDLVMVEAMKNPYFVREVQRTRRTIYAAQDAQKP